MLLKRHYDPASLKAGKPVCTHVEIKRDNEIWKPSDRLVMRAVQEGWMRLERGELVLVTAPGEPDARYKVLAPPGRYCCHCGESLGGERQARGHVAAEHGGKPSPNGAEPAGYARQNFFLVERIHG